MAIKFIALETEYVRKLQNGGVDDYGNIPHRATSNGVGVPCRHCMEMVGEGEEYLVLAHRPFSSEQPYAETGPILLHAKECDRAPETSDLPQMYEDGKKFILRGYRPNDWINYDFAKVVPLDQVRGAAETMLAQDDVSYLHMRSAECNCFHCRVEVV